MSQKQCSKCKEWKDGSEFTQDKARKDGLRSDCKTCQAIKRKAKYQVNREQQIEKVKAYRNQRPEWVKEYNQAHYRNNHQYHLDRSRKYKEENRAIVIEKGRQRYNDNREKYNEQSKFWQRKNRAKMAPKNKLYREAHKPQIKALKKSWDIRNRDKAIQYTNKRRFSIKANGGNYTVQEWLDLCGFYNNICLRCGIHAKDTPQSKLSPDHVLPLSKGGSNDISNIQPLCLSCNIAKHNRIIDYRT